MLTKYNKMKIMIDPIHIEGELTGECYRFLLKWKREKHTKPFNHISIPEKKLSRFEIGIKTFSDYQLVFNFISRNSELKEKIERMLCVERKTHREN